jgi:transcriptional pleiotropic regulator of transition state genes
MKATGIVRRIDDLGRISIPKELRRVYNIKEGDPVEIYTDVNCIIIKKYDPALTVAVTLQHVITELQTSDIDEVIKGELIVDVKKIIERINENEND